MSDDQKLQEAKAAVEALSSEQKAEVGIQAVGTLPTAAIDAKKNIASAALKALPPEDKKDVVAEAAKNLPVEQRAEVAETAGRPTQRTTDWIWRIIVGAFALAFLASIGGLLLDAALTGGYSATLMLPVFTTLLGTLAGFLTGRSTGEARG